MHYVHLSFVLEEDIVTPTSSVSLNTQPLKSEVWYVDDLFTCQVVCLYFVYLFIFLLTYYFVDLFFFYFFICFLTFLLFHIFFDSLFYFYLLACLFIYSLIYLFAHSLTRLFVCLFVYSYWKLLLTVLSCEKSENLGPSIPDESKEVSSKTQKDLKRKLKQSVRTTPLNTDEEILRVPLSASKGLNGQQLKIQATYSRVPITDNTGSQGLGQGSAGLTGLAGLGIAGFGGNVHVHGNGSGIYGDGSRYPASLPSTRGKYENTQIHIHIHTHTHTHTHSSESH